MLFKLRLLFVLQCSMAGRGSKRDRTHLSSSSSPQLSDQLNKFPIQTSSLPMGKASTRSPVINEECSRPLSSHGLSSVMTQSYNRLSLSSRASSPDIPSPGTENSYPPTSPAPPTFSPSGYDSSDGRTWIYPEKKTFNPAVATVRNILPVIQEKFDHPCFSWKATPPEYKKMWFDEWACAEILRNTMHTVRQDLYQKQVGAKWIPRQVMTELERIWASEDYKAKCEIAKAN
ncbi:uncharacterized protein LOC114758604 isoform X1 [Neltuma alba]|uniref:uncharacterized protein LOC114758604 isoform X1 n=3 Tax=Neltuma alba TaxID=207710 RepID=UPI0010A3C1C1|nr:uncharacterized protein LOC114758604 isoform X1 [Prosopis alba]XP_028803491.1 uncharacterized protein LOC114758604 isoform X1 [Prosopis alba]